MKIIIWTVIFIVIFCKFSAQVANDFVNNNWRTLYKEMLPYAQENWSKMGIKVSNKIFLKVPYDQLFPVKS